MKIAFFTVSYLQTLGGFEKFLIDTSRSLSKWLKESKKLNTDFFLYFYNSDTDSVKKLNFLNQNLIKIKDFNNITQDSEYRSKLYRIIYTGNNFSNQSVVYKIPDILKCDSL